MYECSVSVGTGTDAGGAVVRPSGAWINPSGVSVHL